MKKIVTLITFVALSLVTLDAKSYKYDDLDRVIEVSYESGEKIFYSYDSAGNMLDVEYALNGEILDYHLNNEDVNNTAVLHTIKDAVNELDSIKDGIDTNSDYNTLKQELDGAMSKLDAIKQAIDNNIVDNDEKIALKDEADKIKREIDAIKLLIDGYKGDNDHSNSAIETIKTAIENVIAMMVLDGSVNASEIPLKAGRNTVSGTIDITKLNSDIHSIWIVDGGNWYGYSPHAGVREEIERKYLLIADRVDNYKGMLVFAISDTEIESISQTSDVVHSYGRGYTLHGTNGAGMSASDVVCTAPNQVIMLAQVRGDDPSVYVPDREIAGIENFEYLGSEDGYYVLCDKDNK